MAPKAKKTTAKKSLGPKKTPAKSRTASTKKTPSSSSCSKHPDHDLEPCSFPACEVLVCPACDRFFCKLHETYASDDDESDRESKKQKKPEPKKRPSKSKPKPAQKKKKKNVNKSRPLFSDSELESDYDSCSEEEEEEDYDSCSEDSDSGPDCKNSYDLLALNLSNAISRAIATHLKEIAKTCKKKSR